MPKKFSQWYPSESRADGNDGASEESFDSPTSGIAAQGATISGGLRSHSAMRAIISMP
jgi:hypothetical protein